MTSSDLDLPARVRALMPRKGVVEKRMFGGIAFLLNGNLMCGASGRGLMVRVGREHHDEAVKRPGASEMVTQGRVFRGYMHVEAEAVRDDEQLESWIGPSLAYTSKLPAKPVKPGKIKKKDDEDDIPRPAFATAAAVEKAKKAAGRGKAPGAAKSRSRTK